MRIVVGSQLTVGNYMHARRHVVGIAKEKIVLSLYKSSG